MSRYPRNPLWSQTDDAPIAIRSGREWVQARSAGYLTPEHVLQRAAGMALGVASGEWDEEGFPQSVAYETVMALGGAIKMRVYTNDHPPPHVHFERRGYGAVSLKFNLLTGELMNPPAPRGWGPSVKKMRKLLVEYRQPLTELWEKNHGAIDLEF